MKKCKMEEKKIFSSSTAFLWSFSLEQNYFSLESNSPLQNSSGKVVVADNLKKSPAAKKHCVSHFIPSQRKLIFCFLSQCHDAFDHRCC